MPDSMRLRTAAERKAPARFGDPEDSSAAVNYSDYNVPEFENLNSDFPHPVYQLDRQLAWECAFPSLPFNHPGPGPHDNIFEKKRKTGEVTTLPPDESAAATSIMNYEHQDEEVDENETEPHDLAGTLDKTCIQPIKRGQTTVTGKPNPAVRNHGDQGLPAYTTPVKDWIAAVRQHEARDTKDVDGLQSMASELDPKLQSFGLNLMDRRIDNRGDWTRTSSEFHLSVSPSPPSSPLPSPPEDPFVVTPLGPSSANPEIESPQPRRPYTVHINRDAAKKKANELNHDKGRDFQPQKLGQKAPDWISLSDGVKYIITYEMTKTGMSFVQVVRTFRLTLSETGLLMNLVGNEQRKIDHFNEEVKKHLHTSDVTWINEYIQAHEPLITDHLTAKEIRKGKGFLKFMGFEKIASKLDEYVGVGAGRRFPILLNHFWGDGFKDLPPHFKAFCSEELDKMASTWNNAQEDHQPPMSTPEMHVRLDPPSGTINPRRLIKNPDPSPSPRKSLTQGRPARESRVSDSSSDHAPAPVSSAPDTNETPNGLLKPGMEYATVTQAQSGPPIQHGLSLFLPDPGYGVPVNPFATLPAPSIPYNPAFGQRGPWQQYAPVQGPPYIPRWPQPQQLFHDRGMYWTGPPPRYREPVNIHFATAMGEGDAPMQATSITGGPHPQPAADYEQHQDVGMAQSEPYRQFHLSPVFGHGSYRAPPSDHRGIPHNSGLHSHVRAPGPMGHYPQQAVNHGPGDPNPPVVNPRRSIGSTQGASSHIAVPPAMGYLPQRFTNSTASSDIGSNRGQPGQTRAGTSRQTVPLLSAAQLALLYETYDQPHQSMGIPSHVAGHVARSIVMGQTTHSQFNTPNPASDPQSALPQSRLTSNNEQDNVHMSDAQPEKAVSESPSFNPLQEIQERDAGLQKEVDQWINKYRDSWIPESESESSSEAEEEILPSMPARSTRARRFQNDDDSDEDFVLADDEEYQGNKKDKKARVLLPAVSRKRTTSAASGSTGVANRSRGAQKKSADMVPPASGTANKRKAAQIVERQNAPKKRRVGGEASTARASSTAGRGMRRKSAPTAGDVSEKEHGDEKRSKPVKGRRQPGGIWGNADTLFTNGRGDILKRREVAALPNTKYKPGGSFGGGKWQEEDTGIIWLPLNPSEQCRKNSSEKGTLNHAPVAQAAGGGEKKSKSTATSQAVKKRIRLVSQQATSSPTKTGSSQASQPSTTVVNSSPVKAPETQSFEEFLSSKGLYTRNMFETDLLFQEYVTQLDPPFSTHPGAPTLPPAPKGRSLDKYIPAHARAQHEAYLAVKRAGSEGSQPRDGEAQEQIDEEEQIDEGAQETSQENAQEKSQEKHQTLKKKTQQKAEENSKGGTQEAAKNTTRDVTEVTLETTGEAAEENQKQTTEVKGAEKNDLLEVLKKRGLNVDAPPALNITEQVGRYSTRLRSAVFDTLSRKGSSSRSVSPAKTTRSMTSATKESAAKGSDTKKTATKDGASHDAATEKSASQSPSNTDGVMTIRTLRPRKGKEVDRGTTPTETLEKK